MKHTSSIMEISLQFNFLTLFLFSSFIFLLINLWKKKPTKPENLPPGPPQLPLIGNLHQLLLLGGLPYHAFQVLARKHGPVMHLRLGQVSTVVISSRETAKEVLKTQDPACADRAQTIGTMIMWYDSTGIIFSAYTDLWRKMRSICVVELLSAKNVKSFGSIRRDEVSKLLASLRSSSGKPVNITDKIFAFTGSVVCRAAFGKATGGDSRNLMAMMKKGLLMGGGFDVADFFPSSTLLRFLSWNRRKLLSTRREMDNILDGILDEHRTRKSGEFGDEDIVDVLLRIQRKNELGFPISNDNIKAIIFDMFSAGTESSSSVLDWTMAELMRNRDVMEKVQAEVREALKGKEMIEESDIQSLKYMKLVIKETFRLHPPIPMLRRACRDECKVNGYTIPLKSRVFVNLWSMGRDPEYWEESERFWPERFENSSVDFMGNDFEYIPFGAGKRMCPGVSFGLVMIEAPLAQLLYHFDWVMPEGMMAPDDIDMDEAEGIAAERKNNLFLVPVAHDE